MDQNELEEPHDDDVVEITHLHQDDEAGRHQPSSHQPLILDWMRTPPGDRCLSTENVLLR